MVVPPSLRTVVEASDGVSRMTPQRPPSPPPGSAVVDEAARARALELMARRLGGAARKPATATAPSPAMPSAQQLADDRAARVASLVAKGEEAQKVNDLQAALESFKGALSIAKDDPGLKARIDAVSQLLKMQKVSEHIEKAKEASRNRDTENAALHWEKAWEGRREDATLLLNAAEILAKTRELKRAAELAQRALAIDPAPVARPPRARDGVHRGGPEGQRAQRHRAPRAPRAQPPAAQGAARQARPAHHRRAVRPPRLALTSTRPPAGAPP